MRIKEGLRDSDGMLIDSDFDSVRDGGGVNFTVPIEISGTGSGK